MKRTKDDIRDAHHAPTARIQLSSSMNCGGPAARENADRRGAREEFEQAASREQMASEHYSVSPKRL
jgi:hypothetical protein